METFCGSPSSDRVHPRPSQGFCADETALFNSIQPDVLVMIDMSFSMKRNPAGALSPAYGNADCSIMDSWTGIDCRRYVIAKRAIFNLLDDNRDGKIDSSDETSLNVRFGYGTYYVDWDYVTEVTTPRRGIGTPYADLYCNSNGTGTACTGIHYKLLGQSTDPFCAAQAAAGQPLCLYCEELGTNTPMNNTMQAMKTYLDAHKAADPLKDCRQKFAIIISDGGDTQSCDYCDGVGVTQYKQRRLSVLRAKALKDAGYKVFVVGFGSNMPTVDRNTLEWMAYYGGTDNPLAPNMGNTAALNLAAFSPNPCTVNETQITGQCDWNGYCYAVNNDPGCAPPDCTSPNHTYLSGYAFMANNGGELQTALKQAMNLIRESSQSFATASIASARTSDENYLYEASFQPVGTDPTWTGHLTKYSINADGTVGAALWDAGTLLKSKDPASRGIYTYKGSNPLTAFTASNITPQDLGLASTETTWRTEIVGYIRGESAYNVDNWKLGDIFRSSPITVGTPTQYFQDRYDANNPTAYDTFRAGNLRTSANGKRIVVAGANDGQLHAFKTSDGSEAWSFIPPNFLAKLKNIAHKAHPTGLSHQYFVDGPITVAEVWLPASPPGVPTAKLLADCRTLLILGESRGAMSYLWSSSSTCTSGFDSNYSTSYPYYCGYHALDITNTTAAPTYKWRLNPTTTQAPYLGEPWSKIYVARVKINGSEKWVGFMGGGHNLPSCSTTDCDKRGKGFFVIDLADGSILWSYTLQNDTHMSYAVPGSTAMVDTDNDGYIDRVYIGDLGGTMWRFKFCSYYSGSSCNTANWTGGRLFSGTAGAVYSIPSAAKDARGNLWVFWGTSDKVDVTGTTTQNKFYAVKDVDAATPRALADLINITTSTYADSDTRKGWYVTLTGTGEKVLGDSAVFGGVVYFTSFTPAAAASTCSSGGTGLLYGIDFVGGTGIMPNGAKSMSLGAGIPSSPVISYNPSTNAPDLFVTASSATGGVHSRRVTVNPPAMSSRANILLWRDRRIQ
jgi:Tfp pilus tip-associated adhesin PilY1